MGLDNDSDYCCLDDASQSSENSSRTSKQNKKTNSSLQNEPELKKVTETVIEPVISHHSPPPLAQTQVVNIPKPKRKVVRRNRVYKNKYIEYTSDRKKVFKCNRENCRQGFASRNELREHKKQMHASEKKTFSCDLCEYKCYAKFSLIVHKRVHTGERPYKCEHCDKAFTQQSTYQKHVMIHIGEKQICEICGVGLVNVFSSSFKKERFYSFLT